MNEVMLEGAGYFDDPPEHMEELLALRKFVDFMLEQCEVDETEMQEKAVELGLVELRPINEEDSIDGEKEHYFTKWTPKEGIV